MPRKLPSTQQYLDITEIKDDTVILKDGTLRTVLLVSSINFALKSEDEQKAIISGYISFLNSLEFPLQIVIQSRKLDIKGYLSKLAKLEKEQINELLKTQIGEYREYVGELVELGEIMSKNFYVVVPYSPFSDKQKGFFSRLVEVFSPAIQIKLKEEKFQKYQEELTKRVDYISSGLQSIGLNVARLDTQSLIELYYNSYNPGVSRSEKLVPMGELRVE